MTHNSHNFELPCERGVKMTPLAPISVLTRFTNVRVLRKSKLVWDDLWVQDGKIVSQPPRAELTHVDYQTIDGSGHIISPGFVEIQLNGAFGIDFSDEKCTLEDVKRVGKGILAHGITAFCPTLVSSPEHKYHVTLPRFRKYPGSPDDGATVLGYHLEGPFINISKKGAHDPKTITSPVHGYDSLQERYGHMKDVKIVTLAPELPGAIEAIHGLREKGVIASIGHTNATYDQAQRGIDAGATMVTHMFNAMSTFHHRDPGVVGLLGNVEVRPYYGIIADGIHTHPCSLRMAYKAHPDGLMLVTDAMAAMGLPVGRHKLGDMDVDVVGIKATIAGTDTLAGAAVDMVTCIKNFRQFTGCKTEEVLEAASLRPAQAVGVDRSKGHLDPGADADFVILNDELDVLATFIDGQVGYKHKSLRLARIGIIGYFDDSQALRLKRLLVIEFMAKWNSLSFRLEPVFEDLRILYPEIRFATVDCDEYRAQEPVLAKTDCAVLPTVHFYAAGTRLEKVLAGPGEDLLRTRTELFNNMALADARLTSAPE